MSMSKMDLYPNIKAEVLGKNKTEDLATLYLFNSQTNRGYSLDGLAAILCKKFDGKKKLSSLIGELESEYQIDAKNFNSDIDALLEDLTDNDLLEMLKEAKE